MTIRIYLADDHAMFRDALCNLLRTQPGMAVVGQTGDGSSVCPQCLQLVPDVVCMDINMPGVDGIETTRQLTQLCPSVRVIALSAYTDPRYVNDMLAAGASAYVTKAEASDELLRAIAVVQSGRTYLCPDVARALAGAAGAARAVAVPEPVLSAREREVAQRVAQGQTSQQIADALYIAPSTVEVHRRNIMRKLDLHNAAELTRYMLTRG